MGKFRLTNKAVDDLSVIWKYTYETWSENQADKYYEFLISSCQELAKKPQMGKSYDKISSNLLGYLVNRHIIFYQVVSENEIEIVRFLHERMDLKNRISE